MKRTTFKGILKESFETSTNLAEVRVSYRSRVKRDVKISSSKDAFGVLYPLFNKETVEYQEEFFLLLLNNANWLNGWIKLSTGGTKGTVVDPKIIFVIALQTNSSGIILCHNHPSGNITPSKNDGDLTNMIITAGRSLEITLFDHLIINAVGDYYSFADEGFL